MTYYERNKERCKAKALEYYYKNREARKEYQKRYKSPHRYVVDAPEGWDVHHFNHNHDDNRPENLLPLPHDVHGRYHNLMRHGNKEEALLLLTEFIMV